MTKKNTQPAPEVPPVDEVNVSSDVTADLKPTDQAPLDPKEEARRRSREDLERKRRNQRGRHGKI